MEKNINDYLPFYLGCECKSKHGTMIYTLISVSKTQSPILKDKYGNECVIFDFKLILRPLSDMTLQEQEYCYAIGHKRLKGGIVELFKDKLFDATQFHYLLSKHFDLFNLHEAGLCVYKSDLK